MKRNLNNFIGIALISSLGFTACKQDAVTEEPVKAALLAAAISSAASGACLININAAGIYYGNILYNTVINTAGLGFTLADYNAATGLNLSAAQFADVQYEEKYRAFFLDNGTSWNTTLRNTRLAAMKTNAIDPTGLNGIVGTGIMACARIPRTSCSITGLTTATRAADITSNIAVYNAVVNNADCRKPGSTFDTMLAKNLFRGTPSTETLALSTGNIFNSPLNGTPLNGTTGIAGTASILPEGQYPKFGSLVSLGFGGLMPINKLGTAYPTSTSSTTSTAFYGGTNMSVTQVVSCDAYGFTSGVTVDTLESARRPLTSPAEVAYSFSTNGLAASAYQAAIQLATIDTNPYVTTATTGNIQDAVACNNSFRARQGISVALGGGKLPTTNGGAQLLAAGDGKGDDRASSLLSLCIYGGTTTARATLRGTVGSATGALIASGQISNSSQLITCGEGRLSTFNGLQSGVATYFTEMGTVGTFPNTTP